MSVDRMLSWFPNTWRSRYEAEVRELLDAQPFTWRERRDLLRACADAWIRETTSWGLAIAKFSAGLCVRMGVVLGLGWLGVRGAEALLPPELVLAWWPAARSEAWRGVTIVAQFATFVAVARYVMQPYEQTRDPLQRPTWLQTFGWVLFLALLVVSDARPGDLPEVIWMGIFATMRYSPWILLLSGEPRGTAAGLGLR